MAASITPNQSLYNAYKAYKSEKRTLENLQAYKTLCNRAEFYRDGKTILTLEKDGQNSFYYRGRTYNF